MTRTTTMKQIALLLLQVLALFHGFAEINASSVGEESVIQGSIQLTARTFDSSISDGNAWLIEFYAPWCGRFADTYESVAKKLHGMHDDDTQKRKVMVAKVDGASDRALASRFHVQAYPTFFLVDGWTVREFDGERSREALVRFASSTYTQVEPIPFLNSPFGPMGQLRAWLMFVGITILETYDYMLDNGYSSFSAACILASAGITIGITTIIVIGFLTLPKQKED